MSYQKLLNTLIKDFRLNTTEISNLTGITQPALFKIRKGITKSRDYKVIRKWFTYKN